MKKAIPVFLFILIFWATACTRDKDTWLAFYNNDTTLVGFKDQKGEVRIAPKFTVYGVAKKFDDIIAVSEFKKPKSISYYLTKKGRIVGRDSLYYFDNTPDCECEGFIRFEDHKSLKMGMFNGNGDVAIPATYNYLSPVRNGLIMALKDAKRLYPEDANDEHFNPWEGGNEVLIDVNNKTLINNFKYDDDIDFYSLIVSDKAEKSAVRKSFRGVNGKYYSFISFEKEFNTWFKTKLLSDISVGNLLKLSNNKIKIETGQDTRIETVDKYVQHDFGLLKSKLFELKSGKRKYRVFREGLFFHNFDDDMFSEYFDNCGMSKDWIYPVMSVAVSSQKDEYVTQDSFDFVRTSGGYKLISLTIRK